MNTPNYYLEFFLVFLGESVTVAMFYDDSVDFYILASSLMYGLLLTLKYKKRPNIFYSEICVVSLGFVITGFYDHLKHKTIIDHHFGKYFLAFYKIK